MAWLDYRLKDAPAQCTDNKHAAQVQYVEPQEDHILFAVISITIQLVTGKFGCIDL